MAHRYWNMAAVSEHEDAIKGRGIVEKKMTSSQIAESQKLAREWMRTHLIFLVCRNLPSFVSSTLF
ncbi:MAG: hypothetical protein QF470_07885 [Methylococcales bacterium]|nr:hypothetical protein [Methylococcales bacterium]